ncbi:hypothetical protein [Actinophytocola sp.]|uniref:hypothetical protein n=1 Tax=Actinophytocola sp. TaxID=1872138 RepID=UPI003D6AC16E
MTAAISCYRTAFGAVAVFRNVLPVGTIHFIELAVGGGLFRERACERTMTS